jgi:hypothetical protein
MRAGVAAGLGVALAGALAFAVPLLASNDDGLRVGAGMCAGGLLAALGSRGGDS